MSGWWWKRERYSNDDLADQITKLNARIDKLKLVVGYIGNLLLDPEHRHPGGFEHRMNSIARELEKV